MSHQLNASAGCMGSCIMQVGRTPDRHTTGVLSKCLLAAPAPTTSKQAACTCRSEAACSCARRCEAAQAHRRDCHSAELRHWRLLQAGTCPEKLWHHHLHANRVKSQTTFISAAAVGS